MRHCVVLAFSLASIALGCAAEVPEPRGSWIEVIREPRLHPWSRRPEEQPGFVAVEVHPDRLVYTFARTPDPAPIEARTVVGGQTGGGYVRRVLSVNVLPDGRFEALTEPGHLGDFFRDLHLILHYRPRPAQGFATDALRPGRGVGGARAALDSCEDSAPCSVGGGAVSLSGGVSLEPFIEPSFSADFELDIDETAPIDCAAGGFGLWGDCPSPLEKALLTVDGSITTGFRLSASGAISVSRDLDLAGSLPAFSLFSGSAPLGIGAITVEAEPIVEGSVSLMADAGEITATAQVTAATHLELGYDDGWDAEFEPSLTPYGNVTTTRAGGLSGGAEIRVGVKIGVKIAGLAGPYAELTTGLGGEFSIDPHGCTWTASVSVDARAEFGGELTIPVIDVEVGSVDLGTIEVSADLFSASGGVPWCSGASTCDGEGHCVDEVFDADVCAGSGGFQACSGPAPAGMVYARRCACTASGWAECGECMEVRSAM